MQQYPLYGIRKYVWTTNSLEGYHYEPVADWYEDAQTARDIFNIIQLSNDIPQVALLYLYDADSRIEVLDIKEYTNEEET